MGEFFQITLPNFVKLLLVVAITIFIAYQLLPPILPFATIQTPYGEVPIAKTLIGIYAGSIVNRFVDGIVSLLVLAGIALLVFQFGYEVQAYLPRKLK